MSISNNPLKLFSKNPHSQQKVLVIILDGIGVIDTQNSISLELAQGLETLSPTPFRVGNAVNAAWMPNLAILQTGKLYRTLKAHGTAVGLPSDEDMGNSEVGHNAIGAGRIFDQGAKLVNQALESGDLFKGKTWNWLTKETSMQNGTNSLHLLGLFSDGNVHSHIKHLFALIEGAKKDGVKKVRLHLLLDGRDVPPTSALDYVTQLEKFLEQINQNGFDCKVASGAGRMYATMDRYESDWSIVERGYNAHVLGEARKFTSIREAIETNRKENNTVDQNLPPFVITENNKEVGIMQDSDAVILFNFRGDRAIQISRALTEKEFSAFPRKKFPAIRYAGMMQYDGDLHLPEHFLVTPPSIDNSLGELLAQANIRQFACSETQKYGHVTYFWNGNKSGKFSETLENYIEIPSDKTSFSERPWMKATEITNETIEQLKNNTFTLGRINFPNGDMVGHTGDFQATVIANSAVDLNLGRILKTAKDTNTIVIVTADHGNADEMLEKDKKSGKVMVDSKGNLKQKTSHTLSPVPFAIYNTEVLGKKIEFKQDLPNAGLANIAATVLELVGFEAPPFYEPSLLVWR